MTIIERSIEINAEINLIYQVSQDYGVRYEWDPFPEKIAIVGNAGTALQIGTQVEVHSKLGMSMIVEFVQLMPPERAAVTMIKGPWFLEKFAGSWIFNRTGDKQTLARFRYTIIAKPAYLRILIEPIAALYFARVIQHRLSGLKTFCEKQIVSDDNSI